MKYYPIQIKEKHMIDLVIVPLKMVVQVKDLMVSVALVDFLAMLISVDFQIYLKISSVLDLVVHHLILKERLRVEI